MKKGLIDIVRYYSTGAGLIYLISLIGNSDTDSLALYHYAIILMYFLSVYWLLITMRNYFIRNKKTNYRKTVILGNAIIIGAFTFWMYLLVSK